MKPSRERESEEYLVRNEKFSSEEDFLCQENFLSGSDENGEDSLQKAKARALKILGSRNFSRVGMKKRLAQKGESDQDAESVVDWLCDIGYIDDDNYAAQVVSHYKTKGYGANRIKDELYRRGVPRDLWDEKLEDLDESEIVLSAQAYLERKLKGSTDRKEIDRASKALVRRGFSYEQANMAVKEYLKNTS